MAFLGTRALTLTIGAVARTDTITNCRLTAAAADSDWSGSEDDEAAAQPWRAAAERREDLPRSQTQEQVAAGIRMPLRALAQKLWDAGEPTLSWAEFRTLAGRLG